MKKSQQISIIMIVSMIITLFSSIPGQKQVYSANTEDVFEFVDTDYGINDKSIKAKELNIKSDDVEIIDPQISNLLFLKENINDVVYKLYLLGPNGLIKTFELSIDDEKNTEWLNAIESRRDATKYIKSFKEYDGVNENGYYTDYIYKVKNPQGTYDILNLTAGEYYEYGFDEIKCYDSREKDSVFIYEKNGQKGVLDCHGVKLTGALYEYCNKISDGYYFVRNDGLSGIVSTDGAYSGELLYSNVQSANIIKNEDVKILYCEKNDGTKGVLYLDLNKMVEVPKESYVRLGYDTAIVTIYDNNSETTSYIIDNKGIKENVCDLFGGEYSTASYTEDGKMIIIKTWDRLYNSEKYYYYNEYVKKIMIDTSYNVIYDGTHKSNWDGDFLGEFGFISILEDNQESCFIIDKEGNVLHTFTDEYVRSIDAEVTSGANGFLSQGGRFHHSAGFECTSKYVLATMASGKIYSINGETRRLISFDSDTKVDMFDDSLLLNDNQYIVTTSSESKQIINLDTGKTYTFENSSDFIRRSYLFGDDICFIVGKGLDNEWVNGNLEKIMDVEYYYLLDDTILFCGDNSRILYDIKGNQISDYSLYLETSSSNEYYNRESTIKARKAYSGAYRLNQYLYVNKKGEIISDNNYFYVSKMNGGLGYFAQKDEEYTYDYDSDHFGIINGDGDVMVDASFDNRFYYDGKSGYSEGVYDIDIGGSGIILKKRCGNYVFYSWKDYVFVSRNSSKSISVVGDTIGGASSELKLFNECKFQIPDEYPIIGGGEFQLDFSDLPVQVEREGNTFRIGIGTKDISKCDRGTWNSFKEFIENSAKKHVGDFLDKQNEDIKKGLENIVEAESCGVASFGWNVKPKISFFGYAEGVISPTGELVSCEGKAVFEIKVKANNEWQTMVGVVPVVIKATGEVGAKVTSAVGLDLEKSFIYLSGNYDFTVPKIRLSAGIGITYIADVSVYGTLEHKIAVSKRITTRSIDYEGTRIESVLSGEAGVSAKLLFASYEKTLWESGDKKKVINLSDAKTDSSIGMVNMRYTKATFDSVYDYSNVLNTALTDNLEPDSSDEYLMNRDESEWVSGNNTENTYKVSEIRTLATDIYSEADPVFLELESGKKIIIYTADVEERETGNHTAIVYSVFNETSNEWSAPIIIDDDGTADFYPSAVAKGNEVYIAWSNCKKIFDGNDITSDSFLEEVASNCEIEVVALNPEIGMVTKDILTEDTNIDLRPQIVLNDDIIYVTWFKNTDNDLFHLSGCNEIYIAEENDDVWNIDKVDEVKKPILRNIIGKFDDEVTVGYVTKDDENSSATSLFVVDLEGNKTKILNETICNNPIFANVGGNSILMWQVYGEDNGNLYYVGSKDDVPQLLLSEDKNVTKNYTYVSGSDAQAIIYTDNQGEDNTDNMYVYFIDGRGASNVIKLTEINENVDNPVGIMGSNGLEVVFLRKSINVKGENLNENTSLCTLNVFDQSAIDIETIENIAEGVHSGKEGKVLVQIKNESLSDCQESTVYVKYNDTIIGTTQLTDSILPGEVVDVEVEYTLPDDIKISDNISIEIEYDGNIVSKPMENIYSDLELSVDELETEYSISVVNNGMVDENARLLVYDTDINGNLLKQYDLGNLAQGDTYETKINKEELNALGDNLYFLVDSDNADYELYECNNYSFIYTGNDIHKQLSHLRAEKGNVRYVQGSKIDTDDLTVYAVYNDGSEEIITDYISNINEIDTSEVGEKEVKITYEEEYIVRSISFDVEIINNSTNNGHKPSIDDDDSDDDYDTDSDVLPNDTDDYTDGDVLPSGELPQSPATHNSLISDQNESNGSSINNGINNSNHNLTVVTPGKVKISSLKNKKSKKFVIKWKKTKNAKGYQVQYALNKKFSKSKKTKTTSKLTLTVKKLKKGKTYYVRVRAYSFNSSGNKVYGKWSAVKKIKIKK